MCNRSVGSPSPCLHVLPLQWVGEKVSLRRRITLHCLFHLHYWAQVLVFCLALHRQAPADLDPFWVGRDFSHFLGLCYSMGRVGWVRLSVVLLSAGVCIRPIKPSIEFLTPSISNAVTWKIDTDNSFLCQLNLFRTYLRARTNNGSNSTMAILSLWLGLLRFIMEEDSNTIKSNFKSQNLAAFVFMEFCWALSSIFLVKSKVCLFSPFWRVFSLQFQFFSPNKKFVYFHCFDEFFPSSSNPILDFFPVNLSPQLLWIIFFYLLLSSGNLKSQI